MRGVLMEAGVAPGNIFMYSSRADVAGSLITSGGSGRIETVALDDVIKSDENVTLIKMDIEGAELNALKGGRRRYAAASRASRSAFIISGRTSWKSHRTSSRSIPGTGSTCGTTPRGRAWRLCYTRYYIIPAERNDL